jgi:hypothetical protein
MDGSGLRPTVHLSVCFVHRCIVDWPYELRCETEAVLRAGDVVTVLRDEFRWYT